MNQTQEPVFEFSSITKRFGRTVALDNVSLSIGRGEILGLLGPNGAGKTTAVRIALGLLRPASGNATIFGLDTWDSAMKIHERIAYVPGELAIWPSLTGKQILDLLGEVCGGYDRAFRDELTELFDFDPGKQGRTYSKGNRQKIAVIAALMTRADLLIFDEPTSGLDPLMTQTFQTCLRDARENGQTILLSSHVLSEVEAICDRVAILRDGRLIEQGTLAELRHLAARLVEATFAGTPPDLDGVPGIENVEMLDGQLRLQVRGSTDPLIKALAGANVTSLQVREPTLEELFYAYYGGTSTSRESPAESATAD